MTGTNVSFDIDTLLPMSLIQKGKIDEAWAAAEREIQRVEAASVDFYALSFVKSEVMRLRGKCAEALDYLRSLPAPPDTDFLSRASLQMHMGYCSSILGDYRTAHALLKSSEEFAITHDMQELYAHVRLRQAMVGYFEYDFVHAQQLYHEVSINAGEKHGWYIYSCAIGGVGKALMAQKRYEEAIPWIEKAITLTRAVGSDFQEAANLGELGVCYWGLGHLDQALDAHLKSGKVFRELGAMHSYQVSLADIGNVYLTKKDYHTALAYYQEALRMAQEMKAPASVEKWSFNIRLAYARLQEHQTDLAEKSLL